MKYKNDFSYDICAFICKNNSQLSRITFLPKGLYTTEESKNPENIRIVVRAYLMLLMMMVVVEKKQKWVLHQSHGSKQKEKRISAQNS